MQLFWHGAGILMLAFMVGIALMVLAATILRWLNVAPEVEQEPRQR